MSDERSTAASLARLENVPREFLPIADWAYERVRPDVARALVRFGIPRATAERSAMRIAALVAKQVIGDVRIYGGTSGRGGN